MLLKNETSAVDSSSGVKTVCIHVMTTIYRGTFLAPTSLVHALQDFHSLFLCLNPFGCFQFHPRCQERSERADVSEARVFSELKYLSQFCKKGFSEILNGSRILNFPNLPLFLQLCGLYYRPTYTRNLQHLGS